MTEQEKREKVIKGLDCCVNDLGECKVCPYAEDEEMGKVACGKNLYSDAIALLEAQEPVKVKIEQDTYPDETPKGFALYYCGNCGDDIADGQKFCANCGQAVKWE